MSPLAPLATGPSVGHMGSSIVRTLYVFKQSSVSDILAQRADTSRHHCFTVGHKNGKHPLGITNNEYTLMHIGGISMRDTHGCLTAVYDYEPGDAYHVLCDVKATSPRSHTCTRLDGTNESPPEQSPFSSCTVSVRQYDRPINSMYRQSPKSRSRSPPCTAFTLNRGHSKKQQHTGDLWSLRNYLAAAQPPKCKDLAKVSLVGTVAYVAIQGKQEATTRREAIRRHTSLQPLPVASRGWRR